ncbi:MAG: 2-succinyl-5-enolpyruvyl-6-hydroxy-3-cyclohexene-1-carboxylic-acid synthase [Candidatus Marinimicrobia bacterium]|nr:2-succinyl-5-enolpyruvyl-6-hydroxy-3-cyclohexene-1-carboxylic-acid synthase [Candidatus Neomarinimicrobiota bacterium]|tara:strand:- start:14014 stop:15651 length:1638 start_codon:yes stop_codon:yes gene_type:complete
MTQNISNTTLSNLIISILNKYKIDNVCICPGSRNTPLNLAFLNETSFKCTSHIDERAAAFFSLGLSKASSKPSIILTTSGTAAANLLPAVIESDLSSTPLIVITADRPKALINTGENQTIKQDELFKDFTRGSIHIDTADKNSLESIKDNIQAIIEKAIGVIGGDAPGPVHLNISFDEPLIDEFNAYDIEINANKEQMSLYEHFLFPKFKYPLIVCGQLNNSKYNSLIIELSEKLNCPIFADPLSQLRYDKKHPNIFSYYDYYADQLTIKPDYIIRFGKKPVSKKLNVLLEKFGKHNMVLFSDYKHYNENIYSITIKDIDSIDNIHRGNYIDSISELEHKTKKIVANRLNNKDFFEGNILNHCINQFANDDNLFIGNSLPVRTLEKFCPNKDKKINIYSNRGASGIDGLIATALGTAYQNQSKRNILILGDVSFFYDMTSLLIGNNYSINLNIIIINNNGGQIFNTLRYKDKIKQKYNKFWTTPIDIDIEQVCKTYKQTYYNLSSINDIDQNLNKILDTKGINIIEIKTDFEITKNIEEKIQKNI